MTILTLFFALTAFATDFGKCNSLFPKTTPPTVKSNSTSNVKPLCFSDFAVLYSVDSKTPVYSIEQLNYMTMHKEVVKRTNHFHEEPMLRQSERSTLDDYKNSGYDRGHMAPANDRRSEVSMEESFSLANMVPQAQRMNRKPWAKIESDTRKYVERSSGNIYIFTGPLFKSSHKVVGPNRVWVPDFIFKLVYDEQENKAWVYFMPNEDDASPDSIVSYQEFVQKTGLNLLNGADPSFIIPRKTKGSSYHKKQGLFDVFKKGLRYH
jgi:endonuclease G, mitochondrial